MKIADFVMPELRAELGPNQNRDKQRTVTPMVQSWFMQFADFCTFHKLALHCGLCRIDIPNPKRAWQHWGECSGFKPPIGDTGGTQLIKLAHTTLWVGNRPQREELRAEQIEWLRQAADVLPHYQLGLHCQRCEADVAAKNSDEDSVYSASCRCTEFIGPNRDFVKLTVN